MTTLKTLCSRLTAPLRRETSQCAVLWRTWTYDDKLSFLYLNMDKVVKNSSPGKLAYICRNMRFQIHAIKFERKQILLLVVFPFSSSALLLKVPNLGQLDHQLLPTTYGKCAMGTTNENLALDV